MSFFTRLFGGKKKQKAGEPVNRAPVEKKAEPEPVRSAPTAGDALNELRFKARTGDPKLTEKHRSGNF